MFRLALATLTVALTLSAHSQRPSSGPGPDGQRPMGEGVIIGKVLDAATGLPVEYVTLTAKRMRDSSVAGGSLTGPDGSFEMKTTFGRFVISVEMFSYDEQVLEATIKPGSLLVDLGEIKLKPVATQIGEVEIEGERSQVSISLDKKVFNVEKDLSAAGGSALDALENVPSVTVDMDGNVALRGSQSVRLLIDGRPSSLTGISSSQALENLPANMIESVEIITNPSARYEAEGLAGIINIVLKKQKKSGFNGLFSVGAGYPHNYSASANLNYGLNKMNLFGSYSGSYRSSPGGGSHHRVTTINDTSTVFDTETSFNWGGMNHHGRIGADWSINPKNSLTASASLRLGTRDRPRTTDYKFYDYLGVLENHSDRVSEAAQTNLEVSTDFVLAYRKLFNGKDHSLSIEASYSDGEEEELDEITENYYITNYLPSTVPPSMERTGEIESEGEVLGKLDYIRPVGENSQLELGARSNLESVDNDYYVESYNDSSDVWMYDSTVSNHFVYDEVVHAAYATFGSKADKITFLAGLRLENTNVTGTLEETNESFEKKYTHLFPTLHVSRDMGRGHKLQVSYSRRIRRPSGRNLNPFTSYADPYNLWSGNPDLNPELTHSVELGDVWYGDKTTISATAYYRHTDSAVTRIRTVDADGRSHIRPDNLNTEDAFGLEFTIGTSIGKWWRINGSANYFRNIVDGENLDTSFTSDYYSYSGRINNMITLWKGALLQLMFNYRGPEEGPQGTRKSMIFTNIGLKQDVLQGNGTFTLKLVDPFNSHKFRVQTVEDNYTIDTEFQRQSRGFVLNFQYRLNNYRSRERDRNGGFEMEEMGF